MHRFSPQQRRGLQCMTNSQPDDGAAAGLRSHLRLAGRATHSSEGPTSGVPPRLPVARDRHRAARHRLAPRRRLAGARPRRSASVGPAGSQAGPVARHRWQCAAARRRDAIARGVATGLCRCPVSRSSTQRATPSNTFAQRQNTPEIKGSAPRALPSTEPLTPPANGSPASRGTLPRRRHRRPRAACVAP